MQTDRNRARELADGATERERSHVDVLATMIDGDAAGALAVEANPRNGNAAHGLAHAWYERGDDEAGLAFRRGFLSSFPPDAAMHCHVSWHLALIELRSGHPERMWAIYTSAIAPGASAVAPPLNTATDAASLLWRAALDGERVMEEQWRPVCTFAVERFPPVSIPFLDVHRGSTRSIGDALGA